ncbi:hypothetical protein [Candidatus Methylomicrobium oryzae]|uniref:hypothetical protein n=1 Tax=Candidatus Methylomicrobium oryzae TaxID=2802053 RepID=UPI00192328CF|nr:hypothetical protein [Methylomicrobium sp. RS1]MBL1263926.1 hypothetical protein [Methylomicrobium sp. RS1]
MNEAGITRLFLPNGFRAAGYSASAGVARIGASSDMALSGNNTYIKNRAGL